MSKITTKAVFKPYNSDQPQLIPTDLNEVIPQDHIVRVIRQVIDKMDLSGLFNTYPGGGTSAFHPAMLLKVLAYAYVSKIYTGRQIAKLLRQDVTFMWLSGNQKPDFRTINGFRSGRLKKSIEGIFQSLLSLLIDQGYVNFEKYFVDGSKYAADANRHQMVWKKNAKRYKELVSQRCRDHFRMIDELNQQENEEYGNRDLEETGDGVQALNPEKIDRYIEQCNQIIKENSSPQVTRKAKSVQKKLAKENENLVRYENQLEIAGERSGYSKTDPDAVAMRMKNDETLPAYNVVIGTEDQFIVNYSIHQMPADNLCLADHLEELEKNTSKKPQNIIGDAGFGTAENYELIEKKEINNHIKYPTFHHEKTKKHKENIFHKDNFKYDKVTDTFTCPMNRKLNYQKTIEKLNWKTQFKQVIKVYECENCMDCPLAAQCKKSEVKNRTVHVNEDWERLKKKVHDNLTSLKGQEFKKQRGMDVESVFGDLKMNQHFRRFHLRGKRKVKTEFGLVALSHNLKKIYLKSFKNAG